jgi:D-alanyl-D-alanine carboxypeptidase
MRIALCTIGLLLAVTGAAPISIPNSDAGQALRGWLSAFNGGDRAAMKRYLERYQPKDMGTLDGLMRFRAKTGGFDLRSIKSSTTTKISAILEDRFSEQYATLNLQVGFKVPHRLVIFDMTTIPTPAEFAPPHLSQTELISALEERIAQVSAGTFSGAVLVAKDGAPVLERAYGLADREHNVRNTMDTKFRIGSMNKMFTATAVMQLVQAGKIDLGKPFGTYVMDYPNKTVSSQVTIRHLLTHTGGTGDIFGPQFNKNRLGLRTLGDYVNLYGKRDLLFKPGSKFDYSNYGFVLLGVVIERVSGENYYDYVREHVFQPAGMTSTDSQPEDAVVANLSIGYTKARSGKLVSNADALPYRASSAGGGYSTVGDLLKFANALLAHKLLNSTYTELMTTGKVDMGGGGLKYGFGFVDEVVNGNRCIGHSGGAPGMSGDLQICTSDGYTVAVLANMDPPAGGISNFIVKRLPRK